MRTKESVDVAKLPRVVDLKELPQRVDDGGSQREEKERVHLGAVLEEIDEQDNQIGRSSVRSVKQAESSVDFMAVDNRIKQMTVARNLSSSSAAGTVDGPVRPGQASF